MKFVFLFLVAWNAWGDPLDSARVQRLRELFPEVPAENIHMTNGIGRVDVDPAAKFSYYVFTKTPDSPMLLLPLAASRFDSQPPGINPDVIELPLIGPPQRTPLQTYLANRLLAGKQVLTLYRGGENPGETASWERGEFAKGARYWTTNANYAWRYGRKLPEFLPDLLNGPGAPVYRFEFSADAFRQMVNRGEVVLGFELPASAHRAFESQGSFNDHLAGGPYLGEPDLGVEVEVRLRDRAVKGNFLSAYQGPLDGPTLVAARREQIQQGYERLTSQFPARRQLLERERDRKLSELAAEERVFQTRDLGEFTGDGVVSYNDHASLRNLCRKVESEASP